MHTADVCFIKEFSMSMTVLPGKRVLFADSNDTAFPLYRVPLESAGCVVMCVSGATQAFSAARDDVAGYNLIILVHRGTQLNAPSVISHIRSLKEYKSTPIVVLATETRGELGLKGNTGENLWLKKPIAPDVFLRRLEELFLPRDKRGKGRPSAQAHV